MTFANNLDPDKAPQKVGLHLRSKLFDIQIIYQQKNWLETMNFLKILKETNIWKNYPACKELKNHNYSTSVDQKGLAIWTQLHYQSVKVNKLFNLTNQIWRYDVTSNLIGEIKQLVNWNSLLNQWERLYNWILIWVNAVYLCRSFSG